MRSLMQRCPSCMSYSLENSCPDCKGPAISPLPPRYSPQDHYGKYRRALARKQREAGIPGQEPEVSPKTQSEQLPPSTPEE